MSAFAPIIEEAWQHRRRRHRALGATALATIAAAAIVIAMGGHGSPFGSSMPAPTVVAASAVLSRPPYMGVRCPGANSISCDRVGLTVWLKRPAVSVAATIAGAPLVLNHRDQFLWPGDPPHTSFDGFLQPAGIISRLHVHVLAVDGNDARRLRHDGVPVGRQSWFGEGSAGAPVRLTIHETDGRTIITHVYVGLRPGWG
jgi:hypothetical protein